MLLHHWHEMKSLTAAHCYSTKQWWNKNWQGKLYCEKSYHMSWGTPWRSWLKNHATSWKAAGLNPNGVLGLFRWMSFKPHYEVDSAFNINEYNISWGVKVVDACGWQHNHLYVPNVMKFRSLNLLEPSSPVQTCTGIPLPLLYLHHMPPCLSPIPLGSQCNWNHFFYKKLPTNNVSYSTTQCVTVL